MRIFASRAPVPTCIFLRIGANYGIILVMNILVTNDDGIHAEGIKNLVEALTKAGDVYVSAPHVQRSASGHGITITQPVKFEDVHFPGAKAALSFEGTPADCVKLGLEVYRSRGITFERVFSGINHGGNLGTDGVYSGTVSAAMEGSINGIPSVAISINGREAVQYETAKMLARQAAMADLSSLDPSVMININVPNLPAAEIRGVKVVPQGPREYENWALMTPEAGTGGSFVYSGVPVYYEQFTADCNDVGADQEGWASVTPMHYDLTNYEALRKLRESGIF